MEEIGLPYLPDFFEDSAVMAHLFAHFDESGKYKDCSIVSFAGLVDGWVRWRAFGEKWTQLLREYQVRDFRAVEALQHSQPFGNRPKGTAEERAGQVAPFIREIVRGVSLAVAVSVDVSAYAKVQELHRECGEDPHYFAFYMTLSLILQFFAIPKEYTLGLVFDDDEETAMRCYQLLKKLKRNIPEVKERVTSVCFSDDTGTPQIQAADLFAYLSRREAQQIFANKPYPYKNLFNSFGDVLPDGTHMCLHAQFYSEEALRAVVNESNCTIVFAKRVRLPR
jgi:hypothetical protein